MNGYTLDTNIVTAHLKKNPLVRQRMRQAETRGHPVMLNAVSYYETRRGLLYAGAQVQLAAFEQLWRAQGIAMIDQAVLDKDAGLFILRYTGPSSLSSSRSNARDAAAETSPSLPIFIIITLDWLASGECQHPSPRRCRD